jgi:hypothetical protein
VKEGRVLSCLADPATGAGQKACDDCIVRGIFARSTDLLVNPGFKLADINHLERRTPLVDVGVQDRLWDAALSPDDRFVAFDLERADGEARMYIAPTDAKQSSERDWILIASDSHYLGAPAWSPDSRVLYFYSDRDGFRCVWAQPLDKGGKPVGAQYAAFHNHRGGLMAPVGMNLGVGGDRFYMLLAEMKGNVWSITVDR